MPAEGKVSLAWQIIMIIFIPIAGIWAFYRIKRLQKAFLYLMIPEIAMMTLLLAIMLSVVPDIETVDDVRELAGPAGHEVIELMTAFYVILSAMGVGITILAIYLIIKWSEEWNKQFE